MKTALIDVGGGLRGVYAAGVLDYCLDETSWEQPLLDRAVNEKPSRCVGFDGLAPAAERLEKSLLLPQVREIG